LISPLLLPDRRFAAAAVSPLTPQPSGYFCPVSNRPIYHPVLAGDGYVYEYETLARWLQMYPLDSNPPSPVTRLPMMVRHHHPCTTSCGFCAVFVFCVLCVCVSSVQHLSGFMKTESTHTRTRSHIHTHSLSLSLSLFLSFSLSLVLDHS
jgi:hypothetical protein